MNTQKINNRYNAEFDTRPDGPPVTWVEKALNDDVDTLNDRINELEEKLDALESRLNRYPDPLA